MVTTCARCGSSAGTGLADADGTDSPPLGWSTGQTDAGVTLLCTECTRTNLRSIEAKLDEEWW